MQDLFFGLGKFIEATFEWLLVPFSATKFGIANVLISVLMVFGLFYWLSMQRKLSRKAIEEDTYI